jgi:hypothetical protein
MRAARRGAGDLRPSARRSCAKPASWLHRHVDRLMPTEPCRSRASGGARRDRTDDLMLAKHALSQLSYGPVGRRRAKQTSLRPSLHPRRSRSCGARTLVGLGGLEPPTSRLSSARSNQLSYKPGRPAGGEPKRGRARARPSVVWKERETKAAEAAMDDQANQTASGRTCRPHVPSRMKGAAENGGRRILCPLSSDP